MVPTKAYDIRKMEYVPVAFSSYQKARQAGIYMTYALGFKDSKGEELCEADVIIVDGKKIVLEGFRWITKTDIGLNLGTDINNGISCVPDSQKTIDDYGCDKIIKNFASSMITKERFKYEKAKILAEIKEEPKTLEAVR